MNKMCITVAEAAKLASVPETVIRRWAEDFDFPSIIDNCNRWDSSAYGKVLNTLRKRILSDIYEAEYQIEYEKRFQEPTSTNSYEYGNEIAFREADRLAKEVVRELKGKSIEQIYNILKGYR